MNVLKLPPSPSARIGLLLVTAVLPLAGGCAGATAPAPYRVANQTRLAAVAPWLQEYAADHPAKRQRVEDVLDSWRIEVGAQADAQNDAAR